MNLEIKHHVLLDLLSLGGDVQKAAEAAKYGSWSTRNPLAGKMTRCPHCRTRMREGARQVSPCCTSNVVKELKAAKPGTLAALKQMFDSQSFAGKRKHPHRSEKKLQINEWRLKFEQSEALMKQAQTEMRGLAGFWLPQMLLGKGAAGSLAEQYVAFLRGRKARALRATQRASRLNHGRSTHAKDLHANSLKRTSKGVKHICPNI